MRHFLISSLLLLIGSQISAQISVSLRVYDAESSYKDFDSSSTLFLSFVQQFDSLYDDTIPDGYIVILRPVEVNKNNIGAFEAGFIKRTAANSAPNYFFTGGKYIVLCDAVMRLQMYDDRDKTNNEMNLTAFIHNTKLSKRCQTKIRKRFIMGNILYADY